MSKFSVGDIILDKRKYSKGYYFIANIDKMHTDSCKRICVKLVSMLYPRIKFPTCFDSLFKYPNYEKQSVRRIQCSEKDFEFLKRIHGIGCFYHDVSPIYEKLCSNPTKFVIFRSVSTKQMLIYHLGKATKVLKRIGFEHNGNYERVRVVKPMVKLQFIGELY